MRICLCRIFTWDLGQRKSPQQGEITLFLFSFPENNHPYLHNIYIYNHKYLYNIYNHPFSSTKSWTLCMYILPIPLHLFTCMFMFIFFCPTFFFNALILFIAKLNANRINISKIVLQGIESDLHIKFNTCLCSMEIKYQHCYTRCSIQCLMPML